MKIKCDVCGYEPPFVLVDGYGVGETLLEGVMFEVSVKKGKLKAKLADEAGRVYFENCKLSESKWSKSVVEDVSFGHEITECPKCNDGYIICEDEDE